MKKFGLLMSLAICLSLVIISCSKEEDPPVNTGNSQPTTPANPTPADATTDVTPSPVLSWTCSDPDAGDVLKYDIYFSSINPPNDLLVEAWEQPNYALADLEFNQTYYWRVTAHDSKNASAVGPIWRFTTGSDIPSLGLVAWYPFNGNANDESSFDNNGTVTGAPPIADRFGNANKAYAFDGNNDYITFQNQFYLQTDHDATFSIWIKDEGGAGQRSILFSNLATWDDNNRFHLYTDYNVDSVNLGFDYREADETIHVSCSTFMSISQWHNLTITRQGINYKVYLDNELINQLTDNNASLPTSEGWMLARNNPYGQRFKGSLDDIRIYDRALSESEILAIYTEGGWNNFNENLVAYWPFNGNANDESNHGWNGTVNGPTLVQDRFGNANSAYFFNNTSINTITTQFPGILGDDARTISFWQTSDNTTTSVSMSYGAGTNYTYDHGCTFVMFAQRINPNQLIVGVDLRFGGIAYVVNDNSTEWHHYTFVVPEMTQPKTQDVMIYRDGIIMTTVYSNWGDVAINTLEGLDFIFGQFVNSEYFEGSIDDIRVYDKALTETEIQALYHEGGWQ